MKINVMKIVLLVGTLGILTIVACNQSAKKEGQDSNEQPSMRQGMDSSMSSKVQTGVYFVNIKDGNKVQSPLIVEMGVIGMKVEPAGKPDEGKGHHHLIIDGSYVEKGMMVPKDATHLHFGKGQTTDTLILTPGTHTLTLQFANGVHESYGKDWSKTISVEVEK
jgi:hypothetical protein